MPSDSGQITRLLRAHRAGEKAAFEANSVSSVPQPIQSSFNWLLICSGFASTVSKSTPPVRGLSAAPIAELKPATRLNRSVRLKPMASDCAPPSERPAMARCSRSA